MDALSLSHLTYRCATVTVNFHRLDHPPFPCKGRLLPSVIRTQVPSTSYREYIQRQQEGITSQIITHYRAKGFHS
jgi:hypothetical protein